jgi:imidazolonepropionase-like amidohydrolase
LLAIINGRLLTVSHGVIEKGSVLIDEGRIVAVGANVEIPKDAQVVDACGKVVTPGLVDAHSHVGIMEEAIGWAGDDTNELTDPIRISKEY